MAEIEVLAEGLAFPEGPVVMADGSVIFGQIHSGLVTRWWGDGRTETICDSKGGPNGLAAGPDGALYMCNNGGMGPDAAKRGYSGGRIERVDLVTGRIERVYDSCDGQPLSAPNDLMFDAEGNLWFTDFGRMEADGKRYGGLYCCRPDGSAIVRVTANALSYNGVGIAPDMTTVYVADTFQARIYAFDRRAEPQQPRLVATVPGMVVLDSLAISAAGKVCVATIDMWGGAGGGISTVTPDGACSFVATGDPVTTNIAFGGEDMRDAYITCSHGGRLVRTRWAEPGMRLVYNA